MNVAEESKIIEEPAKVAPHLDATTLKINSLMQEIDSMEETVHIKNSMKENIDSQIKDNQNKIQNIKDSLDKLYFELTKLKSDRDSTKNNINNLLQKSQNFASEIDSLRSKIEEAKYQIRELRKISIIVQKDGGIFIDKDISIPDKWESIYHKLLNYEIMGNVTVKQVQQMAKLLALHYFLMGNEEYFELIFEDANENNSIKTLFDLLLEEDIK